MFLLYEVLLYLVFVITLPVFLFLGVLRGKYLVNFPARLGFYRTKPETHDLWIHAVSVGETLAARTVVAEILRLRPDTSIVFTTTTITGQAQARRFFSDSTVTYFPFDFAFSVRRFLRHHRPRVFATMETELWPNVTRLAKDAGLRLILANGRISDRSFPRYRAVKWLVARLLASYARVLAREETDRKRFIALGAPEQQVETAGNVKFDYEPATTTLEIGSELQDLIAGRPVFVLGSTTAGEDESLLSEVERLVSGHGAFVIVAPRKAERFEIVAALLATTSLRFARRSAWERRDPAASVLLLDSFGELAPIYAYATAAFIGGSLEPVGGHNPIEAAAAGIPVCFGPFMSNFREIASVFLRDGGAVQVADAGSVTSFFVDMAEDAVRREAMASAARAIVQQNRGASRRTAERIIELLA